jgi:hypothetical protein
MTEKMDEEEKKAETITRKDERAQFDLSALSAKKTRCLASACRSHSLCQRFGALWRKTRSWALGHGSSSQVGTPMPNSCFAQPRRTVEYQGRNGDCNSPWIAGPEGALNGAADIFTCVAAGRKGWAVARLTGGGLGDSRLVTM